MKSSGLALSAIVAVSLWNPVQAADDAAPETKPSAKTTVGEKVPSDDEVLKNFHSLGLIQKHTNIFRCASPVKDLVEDEANPTAKLEEAKARLQRLRDLGVRTIISFENPSPSLADAALNKEKGSRTRAVMALEQAAAEAIGLKFVSRPVANAGKRSLEDMSDADVQKLLDSLSAEILKTADDGGVMFHCSAGHDRTGIVTAYMRMKYQHWPVDQAIDEMRRYGHNWPKFSANGGQSSWHEEHLRGIEKLLEEQSAK
jgi:hypothetical protein